MRISVVVPARNEENAIGGLIDALLNQSLAPAEIIIADGGSTDSTCQIVESYSRSHPSVQLIRAGPSFPGRARNVGARKASCDWIAFIDVGNQPDRNWLEALAERAAANAGADVVFGSFEPVTDTLFKECAALAYIPPASKSDGLFIRAPSIVSVLMRKRIWEDVGGFPEHLRSAEDLLFIRAIEAKSMVVFAPRAVVHWTIQPTLTGTFTRFVVYARNNIRAGLWSQWQAPVFRRYALLFLSALPAIVFGPWWLIVPLTLFLLMLVARSGVSIWRNRYCYPAGLGRNLGRLVILIPLIGALDAATFAGSIQWFLQDRVRPQRGTQGNGDEP